MNPLYLIVALDVGLPTIIFYCWIFPFAWHAWKRRESTRYAAIFLAIGIAPYVIYTVQYLAAYAKHQKMVASIVQAQTLPRLANPPRTLVIHGAGDKWPELLVEMGAFDEVYLTQVNKPVRITNERNAGCGDFRDWMSTPDIYRSRAGLLSCATSTSVAHVPEGGLHLYMGLAPRPSPGPLGQEPLPISRELRMITGDRHQFIGYWAIPYVDYPAFPPILSMGGFYRGSTLLGPAVPNYGEVSFLFARLELKSENLKPGNFPSPDEIRAEFIRRRDSPDHIQQRLAGFIATAVGASALSASDIEPVLASDAIDRDFAREIGFEQFCPHIDRLCDFQESLVAACKQKRTREKSPQDKCDRLPKQCDWCTKASLCRPYVTGMTTGCTAQEAAERAADLAPLRQGYP